MFTIGFCYREGLLATTGKDYKVEKTGKNEFSVEVDMSLKNTFDAARVLRKAADEVVEASLGN